MGDAFDPADVAAEAAAAKAQRQADARFMALALDQARAAGESGEVPVGAILVRNGRIIATGRNAPIAHTDPTAHAEIVALREAAKSLGNYRLEGCTLYVTLEPCPMCSGAMLHARLGRVVYGAPDPKTGAAGSVVDLFSNPTLNHQTAVQGGVMAEACGEHLREFFRDKRESAKTAQAPQRLRDDAVRTPDDRFANLPGYPWKPNYLNDLPSLDGLRLHYLDEGPRDAPMTWLCLHGNPSWSYVYRKMIPVFLEAGHRVVAPDLVGFGRSDKPKRESQHGFSWHRQVLLEFVERLDLRHVALAVQDWGGLLGLTLPMEAPERYDALLVMNTLLATGDAPLSAGFLAWREMCAKNPEFDIARLFARGNPQLAPEECAAYMAPFPGRGHRAATRAFPPMVPEHEDADGAPVSRRARDFWRADWRGRALMAIGIQDPVLGVATMRALKDDIAGCEGPILVENAGHFVQEQGEAIAREALRRFVDTPGP